MKLWKKLVNCKNKYQSFADWVFGRWRCPQCKTLWFSAKILDDMTYVVIEKGKVTERYITCPKCGFHEVIE